MKSQSAADLLHQIDLAIKDISGFTSASQLENSYLAKFLVVFICGIYEEAIEVIVNEMVGKLNNSPVSNYVSSSLGYSFRNPNMYKIKKLLEKFDKRWKKEMENLPGESRAAIDSICSNKNGIAHGGTVNVTIADVYDSYAKSKPVVEKIDDLLL